MKTFIIPLLLVASTATFAIASTGFKDHVAHLEKMQSELISELNLSEDKQQRATAIMQESLRERQRIMKQAHAQVKALQHKQMGKLEQLLSEEEIAMLETLRHQKRLALQQGRRPE